MKRDTQRKWFSSPVTRYEGLLSEIRHHIPTFERRPFGVGQSGEGTSRVNNHLDMVVRMPVAEDNAAIPIGVVSKNYLLVQHVETFDAARRSLESVGIAASDVRAEMQLSEYGERMALSLYLPDKYSFDPGDGHPMELSLECFNSVDGSTRFRVLMGWFRIVCSNGLIIGVTRLDVHRRHSGDLELSDIDSVLISGIGESETEKKQFQAWLRVPITLDEIASWVDESLHPRWGAKAAARAFHIARTGMDAEVVGPYTSQSSTTLNTRPTNPVPGTPSRCRNLFDLGQILAWLSKERRDVQEQLEWRETIPLLLTPLMR